MKWKKRRRRASQVFATEKPSPYIILSLLGMGVALLLYVFWPFGGVTSPARPQPPTAFNTNAPTVLPLPPDTPGSDAGASNSPSAMPVIPTNSVAPSADVTDTGIQPGASPTNVPAGVNQSQ